MDRPKIVLFAYSEVGCLCLEELIKDGANIAAVFTHNDDPGEEIWFRSVRAIAEKNGIPVCTPQKLGAEEADYLRSLEPELILSCYYRALIPKAVLDMPRLGAYNIHGALLPKYRGRACVNWAVLNGEKETGATLHVMTERADRGDIVDQERVPIEFTDTAYDVFMKVAEAARLILARRLPELEAGTAPRRPQDEAEATCFGRRRPEDGEIDWDKSAVEIYNLI
ncbi:formyltransferase, partial [Cloacibacillus sp.]|uniref:formyltransferase n=1 Tax=Cloacibacillus sp. TaxID=2049023 RepID=UPI0025BD6408